MNITKLPSWISHQDEQSVGQPEAMEMEVYDASLQLPHVLLPVCLEETSVVEQTELNEASVVVCQEFTVVPRGTTRGKVCWWAGYSYTIKKESKTTRFWWCSVRRNGNRCPATVSEQDEVFTRRTVSHSHPADPDCLINKHLSRQVKDVAARDVFRSAMIIVEDHLQKVPAVSTDNLPRPDTLARKAPESAP